MLEPWELYNLIADSNDYKTAGDDVQYLLKYIDGDIYLLFQETRSKRDWKINFDFPCKCYKNQEHKMYGHRGFIKAYKSAHDVIMDDLLNLMRSCMYKYIIVAGWSQGGAYAQLCCEDIAFKFMKSPILITFGSPKVLLIGRKWIEEASYYTKQYANVNDVVPILPPFYRSIGKVKLDKLNIKKLWKWPVHCDYDNTEYYK